MSLLRFTLRSLVRLLTTDRRFRSTLSPLSVAVFIVSAIVLSGCDSGAAQTPSPNAPLATPTNSSVATADTTILPIATATIASTSTPTAIPQAERQFVPILAYHHIRNWVKSDSAEDRAYIVPPDTLEGTLKYLKENGYQSVSSEQLYKYYARGLPLPQRPIMLSFDDNDGTQYTNALPPLVTPA